AKFSKEGGRMIVFSRGFSVEKAKRIESIEIKVGNEKIKAGFSPIYILEKSRAFVEHVIEVEESKSPGSILLSGIDGLIVKQEEPIPVQLEFRNLKLTRMLNYEEKRAYTVDLWDPGTMRHTGKVAISVQDVDEFFPVVKNAVNNVVRFTSPWILSRRTKIGRLEFTDNDGGKYSTVRVFNYEDDLSAPRRLDVDDENNVFLRSKNFTVNFSERFIASSGERRTVFSIQVSKSAPPSFFLWFIPVFIFVSSGTAAFLFTKRRKDELDEIRTASDPTPEVFSHDKLCNFADDSNSETICQFSDGFLLNSKSKDSACRFEQNYFVVTTPVSKFLSDSDSDEECSENCESHRGKEKLETTLRRGGSIKNGELHI
ncbi:unnamed protein product, partial [Oikopleura dioica]